MVKKFLSNIILLLAANLLVKPLWIFGIDRLVQNSTGEAVYGLYAALLNFTLIPAVLMDLGINQYNNTVLSGDPKNIQNMYSRLLPLKVILIFFYAASILILVMLMGYQEYLGSLLYIMILNQVLAGAILYLRTHFSALHMFKTDTLLSISDKLLMIGFCAPILWTGQKMDLQLFVYLQLFAYCLTLILCLSILYKHIRKPKFEWNFRSMKSIWKDSSPFALMTLLMVIYMRADTILLQKMLPDGNLHSGIYTQSFRLFDAVNMVAVLSASLLLPIFARMIAEKSDIQNLVKVSSNLLLLPSIVLAAWCIACREEIMSYLYKTPQNNSFLIFGLLMLAFIPVCGSYVYGTLLTAGRQLKFLNILSFCALVFSLTCNYILIPKYQSLGAAITALITYSSIFVVQLIYTHSIQWVRIDYATVFKHLIHGAVVFIIAYLTSYLGWALCGGLCLIGSAVMIFATSLVKTQDVYKLLPIKK